MYNVVKLTSANTSRLGYAIIGLSALVLLVCSFGLFSFGMSAEGTRVTINVSQVGLAVGLYLTAFGNSHQQSALIKKHKAQAASFTLVFAMSLLIAVALVTGLSPQRMGITSSDLSLMAIVILLVYNVSLRRYRD
ncbi:hypothetical protein [Mucilaginibacter sp. CSA2-8R]|uniref:hypothetical protein n=1 Tax=Mucilaginibacter sp. CSA2-8R TaxID=3141542 RepID=UPI00315DBF2D